MENYQQAGVTCMEDSRGYSKDHQLIDFFKSEMPLRDDREEEKQKYSCRPGSLQWSFNPAAPPESAIVDSAEHQREPVLVDFFKGDKGDPRLHQLGVDAAFLNRSSFANPPRNPWPTLREAPRDHWRLRTANPLQALKLASPSSTGTEESGIAAPTTPTCDLEIAYNRLCCDPNDSSAQQGSTFSLGTCSKLPPSGEVCADSGTSHGRQRDPPPFRALELHGQEDEDEEAEAVVQAATSLLSLASSEGSPRPRLRRPRPEVASAAPVESDREVDDDDDDGTGLTSPSVLARPTNKRRYRLVADLLADSPSVR